MVVQNVEAVGMYERSLFGLMPNATVALVIALACPRSSLCDGLSGLSQGLVVRAMLVCPWRTRFMVCLDYPLPAVRVICPFAAVDGMSSVNPTSVRHIYSPLPMK